MSNQDAPTMAALFKDLTIERELPIRAMTVKDQAHLTFGSSVEKLPTDLPQRVFSGGKEVPIIYHTYKHS